MMKTQKAIFSLSAAIIVAYAGVISMASGESAEEYYQRGQSFFSSKSGGKGADPIADFSKAIELKPDFYQAYFSRGLIYDCKGEKEKALSDYNKTIEINPKYVKAYLRRAFLHGTDFAAAINDLNRAIEIEPGNYEAYNYRGMMHDRKGDVKRALSDYDESIKLDPARDYVKCNRGVLRLTGRDFKQAISDYAAGINCGDIGHQSCFGGPDINRERIDDLDHFIIILSEEIETGQKAEPENYLSRGLAYLYKLCPAQRSEFYLNRAIADFNQAIKISPGDARIYYIRGVAYYFLDKYKESLADLKKAESLGYETDPGVVSTVEGFAKHSLGLNPQ